MLTEIAHAWAQPQRREFLASINGPEAVLDWCMKNSLSPGDLDSTPLDDRSLDELVEAVAVAHLTHAIDQDAILSQLFPTSTAGPARAEPRSTGSGSTVTVFCGARHGVSERHREAAGRLGAALALAGHSVCYGGASIGLMGTLADAALTAGGAVYGVIPRNLLDFEIGHPNLTRQHVVGNLAERKAVMVGYADAVVTLPGGLGTLDELFEVATLCQLGLLDCPIYVLDVEGYFRPLQTLLDHLVDQGFLSGVERDRVTIVSDLEELLQYLAAADLRPDTAVGG